ncbi:MAG TPA: polysaccharide biosynthesis C-terminal domain-containing protein [Solirubrobacterales bacterium]|nr:polysaccharide biosynthesis C-terminal domain-containing protein [Solirubrobacterales bacterium]
MSEPKPEFPGGVPSGDDVMTAAGETTGASTLTGGAWTSLSYALPQVYTLVLSVVAARYLGADGMGEQSFIAWTALSMTTLVTAGLAGTLQRYVAEMRGSGRDDQAMSLLHGILKIVFVCAIVGGSALIAIGLGRGELESAWIFAGIACAAAVLHSVPHALLLGYQRFRQATIAGLVTGGFGVVATIIVLAMGGGIAGIFAVEMVGAIAALAWFAYLGRGIVEKAPPAAPLGSAKGAIVRYAAYASLTGLLVLAVERRSEFLALEVWSNADQIAFYSIAFGGITALVRLVEGATAPIVPVVATLLGAGDRKRIVSGLSRGLRLLLMLALPATAAGLALGGPAIELVYGKEYADAEPVLLVLAAAFPLLVMLNLSGAALDGLGKVRLTLIGMLAATVVDATLAITLVPELDAVGAAIANAGAQVTAALILLFFLRRSLGPMHLRLPMLAPMLAVSVLAGLAGWLAAGTLPDHFSVLAAAPAFFVVLTVSSLLLRPLPREDADWIGGAVGGMAGGRVGRVCERLGSK